MSGRRRRAAQQFGDEHRADAGRLSLIGTTTGWRVLTREVRDFPRHAGIKPHPRIRKLFLDAQGTLWINTFDGSCSRPGATASSNWSGGEYADSDAVRVASDANHLIFMLATGDLIRRDSTARMWIGGGSPMRRRRAGLRRL